MIGFIAAALSAAGFYFSLGLGDQWWLAWLAPVPVLWFAFAANRWWHVFLAAFAAAAFGGLSILRAYAGLLPPMVLALAIGAPAVAFAFSALGARLVDRRRGAIAASFAFAALWTAFDFLSSFSAGGGSVSTPAAAEVGAPFLIQSAALVGFPGITFLLGLVSSGFAVGLYARKPAPVVLAAAFFAANAVYGMWRISAPPEGSLRVALIDSNDSAGPFSRADEAAALKHIDAYVAQIEQLAARHVQLIVLPENIARIAPQWRATAQARLQRASDDSGATLVAGFNTFIDGSQRNISWAFTPDASKPVTYIKRRLVPVLESAVYTPGPGPEALANGTGVEICKDMDFDRMIRTDEIATHPVLLAVPAWDFGKDDWFHARVAVLRSVENGVPMARSARDGLLTLNDRYGRLVAAVRTQDGFRTLEGNLPLAGRGGHTLYDRLGDAFGWASIVLALGLVGWSFAQPRRSE